MISSHKKILISWFATLSFLCTQIIYSENFPFPGERPLDPGFHAFVGGDIQVTPDRRIKSGILLIRDGTIEKVGKSFEIPSYYREWNCSGKTIYPGLVDPYLLSGTEDSALLSLGHEQMVLNNSNLSFFGLPKSSNQKSVSKFGTAGVHPERNLVDSIELKEKNWKEFRKYGFTSAHLAPSDGIFRGTGPCILLHDNSEQEKILKNEVAQLIAFDPVGRKSSPSVYPNSLMGVLSVIRQTFLKVKHAQEMLIFEKRNDVGKPLHIHSGMQSLLKTIMPKDQTSTWFESGSMLMHRKAIEIATDFNLNKVVLILTGDEWRRPDLGISKHHDCILPVNFAAIPNLPKDDDWEQISLDQLRAWNNAPGLANLVFKKSKSLSFTTSGCNPGEFHTNLLKCIANGLPQKEALASLTVNPAKLCGISKFSGTLENGKLANFFIVEGSNYFVDSPQIHSTWIKGIPDKFSLQKDSLASPKNSTLKKKSQTVDLLKKAKGPVKDPGFVLFQNFHLWTSEMEGVLRNHDILVENGQIKAIGQNLSEDLTKGAEIIKGKGKHLTPGIIDCHSHAMILGGVNESTLPSTAMVRIADVINSESVNIERQLAGGVTTCNLLHGSANPIGGQNAVIKLRMGASPEELFFQTAPAGIKFALGENVKQANWGDKYKTRFPQSRMGVKTFFENRFNAALSYREKRKKLVGDGKPHLKDLELEAILEIIEGKRLIHCHSYRQDEILVFLRTMESFGVRVASLQHVLEGYKVADEIAQHGAGASTFSDWWAYKFEVYDAIPYAGAIMHERGCVVSFNSDSPDHARRLNLEAAKAVKYGSLSEEDALKFVTLNPAIQLGIDSKVGSLKVGKDADFAIWTASPLDYRAVCDQTWIDGKLYHDLRHARKRNQERKDERENLLALAKKQNGEPNNKEATQSAKQKFFRLSLEVACDLYTHSCRSHDCLKQGGNLK